MSVLLCEDINMTKKNEDFQDIFTLKGRRIYKCEDSNEWASWFKNPNNRIIKRDQLWNGYIVSTLFLGINENKSGKGKKIFFETTVFDDLYKDEDPDKREPFSIKASTYKEAVLNHIATRKQFSDTEFIMRTILFSLVKIIRKINKLVSRE